MTKVPNKNVTKSSFWLTHPDATQSAVYLALHWLAYVYPDSEDDLPHTLRQSLPYQDEALSRQWRQFLETASIEDHVSALEWLSKSLSRDQLPFLIESAWRLLLSGHALPNQAPLALRLLARILKVSEAQLYTIGEQLWQSLLEESQQAAERPVLLPHDPRYLDRVEWRLYGGPSRDSRQQRDQESHRGEWIWHHGLSFSAGAIVGVSVLAFLVWGPVELGQSRAPLITPATLDIIPPPSTIAAAPPTELDITLSELISDIPAELAWRPEGDAAEEYDNLLSQALQNLEDLDVAEIDDVDSLLSDVEIAAQAIQQGAGEAVLPRDDGPDAEQSEPVILTDAEPEVTEIEMRITASVLNVRAQPSVQSEVIMQLSEGQRVWVDPDKAEDEWEHVRMDSLEGYASGRFMAPVDN